MRASDFLRDNRQHVSTCAPEEAVETVVERMALYDICAMPVCGPDGALVGVITVHRLAHTLAKDSARRHKRRVVDVMSREIITCGPAESMAAVEKRMRDHRICQIPVVEGGKVIRMLSFCDVYAARLNELRIQMKVLEEINMLTRYPAHDVPRYVA
jgi:predicted transcriptional regulator